MPDRIVRWHEQRLASIDVDERDRLLMLIVETPARSLADVAIKAAILHDILRPDEGTIDAELARDMLAYLVVLSGPSAR